MNFIVPQDIETYALTHGSEVDSLLNHIYQFTCKNVSQPQMLTGPMEGRFLKTLIQISNACEVLELGTFTGYGTLWMASGLPENGHITTCEYNPTHAKIASDFFTQSAHASKITLKQGPALDTINTLTQTFDLVFVDADKENYINYYEALLPKVKTGGLIVFDNMLWSGRVLSPQEDDLESTTLHALNQKISKDSRVEAVLLTIRDGIQMVRKK